MRRLLALAVVFLPLTAAATACGAWSILVAIAWGVTLVAAAHVERAVRAGDGVAALRAAAAPGAAVLPLAWLALIQLAMTKLAVPPHVDCGGALPPHVFALVFAGAGAAAAQRADSWASRHGPARWGAAVALAAAVVAVVTASHRGAADRFPAANAWVDAWPVIARMAPGDGGPERQVVCGAGGCVERRCKRAQARCVVSLDDAAGGGVGRAKDDDTFRLVDREAALAIRHARGAALVLVQEVGRASRPARDVVAFDVRTGAQVYLPLRDVRETVVAPPGWVRGGPLGLVAALVCALVGVLRPRPPRDGWALAEHVGGGDVRVNGARLTADVAARLPPGAVFVRLVERRGAAYRGEDGRVVTHCLRAVGGDPDASRAALAVAPLLLALGALLALAAPALVARWYGLA